jgi:hypothetical protein
MAGVRDPGRDKALKNKDGWGFLQGGERVSIG